MSVRRIDPTPMATPFAVAPDSVWGRWFKGIGDAVRRIQHAGTGWSVATGTRSRAAFDPATVTTEQAAQRLAALIDDLREAGILRTDD